MFTYASAVLTALSVHIIEAGGSLQLSKTDVVFNNGELRDLLTGYCLGAFKDTEEYEFTHETALRFNELYSYCNEVFKNPARLHEFSVAIVKHLSASSSHPGIKPGEVFVAHLSGLQTEAGSTDALLVLKAEQKKDFVTVVAEKQDIGLQHHQGLDLRTPDKACLILNNNATTGYQVFVIDHAGKGGEAKYWVNDFLKLKERSNEFSQTKHLLNAARHFITDRLPTDYEVNKTDQAELLNRSIDYFKANEHFNATEFERQVFVNEDIINAYKDYGRQYQVQHSLETPDGFMIDDKAVKRQARNFKSVLKLDKNFHVYIHGPNELIERGVEEDGRKFYKIYYREES